MKEQTRDRLFIFLMTYGMLMLLLLGIFLISYYFQNTKNDCISDPFVYGARQLEEQYDVKVNGVVTFWGVNHVRMYFNSEEQTVENDKNQKLFLPI